MSRATIVASALVVIAAAVFLGPMGFAPTALGGSSSYAIVVGSSMEPLFHRGDLVVVREARDYEIGDIVLYRSTLLQRHVLHRIVRRDGSRYVLQGDHNAFTDPDTPTKSQVVGRLSFALPDVGSTLQWAHTPGHTAIIVFLAALIALAPTSRRRMRATP